VFQRRYNGSVDFYRNFSDYEDGFGNVNGEHWLGLRKIYEMTNTGEYELRIDIKDINGLNAFEVYSAFELDLALIIHSTLEAGQVSGRFTLADPTYGENGMSFSTKDRDLDHNFDNCVIDYHGGWWYNQCCTKNLNGLYNTTPDSLSSYSIYDNSFHFPQHIKLIQTKMMFREIV
ncbi:FBCD1-like protein, partial [Mya arenaria]